MSQHLCGMFKSTEGAAVVHLMRRSRMISHLLVETRALTKIHLLAQKLEAGGRLSENTTEVWWYGIASVDSGVVILQNINVLMSACYTPSDEPGDEMVTLLAEQATLNVSSSDSKNTSIRSMFVFGVLHSNNKNQTVGSSFIPSYSPKFTLACREHGVQNAMYIEYACHSQENEETTPPIHLEKPRTLNGLLSAQVFDIGRGIRYFTHLAQCFYPPQSLAERSAFVSEFLSHVAVSKAPPETGAYEDELKKHSSLRPSQRRLLKGRDMNERNIENGDSGGIDREE